MGQRRLPMIKEVSWAAVGPQLVLLAVLVAAGHAVIGPRFGVTAGALVWLAWRMGGHQVVARHHRAGIRLLRARRPEQAIGAFERSIAFFERHPWVDRHRALVLLSPSRMCYREMALVNIAFAWGQLGDGVRMKQTYERALAEYPDNPIAAAALQQIAAIAGRAS
ncbi:MAG: hypothetical protein AMXMBFR64_07740 [Myxococcales bacterium]